MAKTDPDSIIVVPLEVDTGLTDDACNKVIDALELQSVRE